MQVQYGYDFAGHAVRTVDAQGRTSQVIYDLFGQKIADNALKADGSTLRSTSYGYDLVGNLITVTDPNQTVRTYTYNSANQPVGQVEPVADGKSVTSSYGWTRPGTGPATPTVAATPRSPRTTASACPSPRSTRRPRHTRTPPTGRGRPATTRTATPCIWPRRVAWSAKRGYDAANRPTSETGTGAEAQTTAATYGYDLVRPDAVGSAVGGTNTYTYDDRGNLFTTAGPGGVAEYRYDEDGSVVSRKDAAGTATFGYDKGRLDTVVDGITGTSQKFGYENTGAVKTIDFGAGRKPDPRLRRPRPDDLRHPANSANATVSRTTYGYNLTDTIASRTTTGVAGAGSHDLHLRQGRPAQSTSTRAE